MSSHHTRPMPSQSFIVSFPLSKVRVRMHSFTDRGSHWSKVRVRMYSFTDRGSHWFDRASSGRVRLSFSAVVLVYRFSSRPGCSCGLVSSCVLCDSRVTQGLHVYLVWVEYSSATGDRPQRLESIPPHPASFCRFTWESESTTAGCILGANMERCRF